MAKRSTSSKKPIPTAETKQERFIRVVSPRVNKVVKSINVLGYCAGSSYEYTAEQATQIINLLHDTVNSLQSKFERKRDKQADFKFKT